MRQHTTKATTEETDILLGPGIRLLQWQQHSRTTVSADVSSIPAFLLKMHDTGHSNNKDPPTRSYHDAFTYRRQNLLQILDCALDIAKEQVGGSKENVLASIRAFGICSTCPRRRGASL